MIVAVADTHTAVWYLLDDPRLSAVGASAIDEAVVSRFKIAISAISLAELVYLVEKGRLPLSAYEDLLRAVNDPEHVFVEAPLTSQIVQSMRWYLVSKFQICQIESSRRRGYIWACRSSAETGAFVVPV